LGRSRVWLCLKEQIHILFFYMGLILLMKQEITMALKMMEDNPFARHIGIKEWTEREVVAPKPEEYTIAEIIPADSLVCLKTNGIYGKSTLAMQAAMSVALGLQFLGKYPCQQGHVIYLSAQDTDDDNCRRFKRLCREWQKSETEFNNKWLLAVLSG
jgi:RecA-family ATPase